MSLPANVDTGLVTGRFIVGVADGPDPDREPDAIPASGTVTFTASVPYLPNPTSTPAPVTVLKVPIIAVLDADGHLCTPDPTDPSKAGQRGIRLIATDDPDLSVQDWTWNVTYAFQPVNGVRPQIASHSMALPSGASIDLTTVVRVPSSSGIGTEQAEALAAAAQAAAAAASQAAQEAAQAAQATDEGVATLVTSGGATTTTLDAAYRNSVSVREYGAVGDGVADDTAAIQAAIDSLGGTDSQGGGTVFFDYGMYNVSGPITVSTPGVHLRSSGAFTASIRVDPAMTGPVVTFEVPGKIYRGPRVSDLRFYMRGAHATALRIVGGYDNFMLENLFIDGVGGDGCGVDIAPPTSASPTLSQTLTAINVWVSGDRTPGNRHTGDCWRINNLQEANFIGCKGLAGGETSGTAYRIEDSRGLQFYGCSAAFAAVGWDIQALTRNVNGITIDGPTIESVEASMITGGIALSAINFRGPRWQVGDTLSAGPLHLSNVRQSTFDTRSLEVDIDAGCTNIQVLTDDRSKVTNGSSSATVIQWANAFGGYTIPSVDVEAPLPLTRYRSTNSAETWENQFAPGTGMLFRNRNGGTIRDGLVLSASPGSGYTSAALLVNDGTSTTSRKVRVGPPDSGGTGLRALTVNN